MPAAELLAAVVLLKSLVTASAVPFTGYETQAWFLRLIERHDAALSAALHDASGPKEYTVSPVMDGSAPAHKLHLHHHYWLRFTTLAVDVSQFVLSEILAHLPETIEIAGHHFHVEGWSVDHGKHMAAGLTTYEELARRAIGIDDRRLDFGFHTPTAFRSQGRDLPLPLPQHVFRSYLRQWNNFAPASITFDLPAFIREMVVLSYCDIKTQRISLAAGEKGWATGFVGRTGFMILPQRRAGGLRNDWKHGADLLRMLAAFSFFCGTGHHTTAGLGQTRGG